LIWGEFSFLSSLYVLIILLGISYTWWVTFLLWFFVFMAPDDSIMMCLNTYLFGFSLLQVCWASWIVQLLLSSNLRSFQSFISLNNLSGPFFLILLFGLP
jgi:hypothetical protein